MTTNASGGHAGPGLSLTDDQVPPAREQSIGELVKSLTEQTSTLVREEIKLAGAELGEKGKRAATGLGMFGAAGLVAGYAGGAVVACLIAALALAVPVWAAALIVAAFLFLVATAIGLGARRRVKQAVPPTPEEALASVRADARAVKDSLR